MNTVRTLQLAALSAFFMVSGCGNSHPTSPCGADGRYAQQGAKVYCAYGVIVGGFRCPNFAPYEVPNFAGLCSNTPNGVPSFSTCQTLSIVCGSDGSVVDAGVTDATTDDATTGEIEGCRAQLLSSNAATVADARSQMLGRPCANDEEVCGPPCGSEGLICQRTWQPLARRCNAVPTTFPCTQDGACRTDQYCFSNCFVPGGQCAPLPDACVPDSDCTCLNPICNNPNLQDIGYSGRVASPSSPNSGISIASCA